MSSYGVSVYCGSPPPPPVWALGAWASYGLEMSLKSSLEPYSFVPEMAETVCLKLAGGIVSWVQRVADKPR
jgi:hypothetical protein